MPKQCQFWPARPAPIQLPIFAEEASLIRVCPERNEFRYYRMAVWPDLFGRALLARHWGRLGTQGRIRLDPHPDPGARSTPSTGSPGKSAAAATRTARCEPAGRVSKGKSEGFALALNVVLDSGTGLAPSCGNRRARPSLYHKRRRTPTTSPD